MEATFTGVEPLPELLRNLKEVPRRIDLSDASVLPMPTPAWMRHLHDEQIPFSGILLSCT